MDDNLPIADRLAAFVQRANWLAPLDPSQPYEHQINHMIAHFDQMGVVEQHPGPADSSDFPAVLQVSDQPSAYGTEFAAAADQRLDERPAVADLQHIDKVRLLE